MFLTKGRADNRMLVILLFDVVLILHKEFVQGQNSFYLLIF